MKKFLNSFFGLLLIVGVVMTVASASNAIVAFKGEVVSFNESKKSDYDNKAMIEGQIYYVYDQIAVEEVTHTTYGVKTGTDETYFYLVETYDYDWIENYWYGEDDINYDPLTLIYATADKDKAAELDKMVEDWYEFENSMYNYEESYYEWLEDEDATEDDFPEMPEIPTATVELSGMITSYSDDKLIEYRNEYLSNNVTDDISEYLDMYCVDMIIKDTDPNTAKGSFVTGIVVGIVGLLGLVVSLVKSKKPKKNEEIL